MEYNFCRRCGKSLSKISPVAYKCVNNHTNFVAHSPTVGVFFFDQEGNVILARRSIDPGKGLLDSIGGFIDVTDETIESALEREIREETGLESQDYETPKYYCSASQEYRYQDEDKPVMSSMFISKLLPGAQLKPTDDVAEIVIMKVADVDPQDIYGDDIRQAFLILKARWEKNEL